MLSRTTILSILLLVTLAASAKTPCDPNDVTSLCLQPLRKSVKTSTDSATTISSTVVMRRRGRGAATGAIIGGALAAGRRPRRGRLGSGGGDDDDDDEFEDEEDDDDDDNIFEACFPASALVNVKGRGLVAMSDLHIGDSVKLASGRYSPLYLFSHRIPRGRFPFVKITTQHGELTVSDGHYIYADAKLITAGSVRNGDTLELANGQMSTITAVETVIEQGLYNPHTLEGELVVDGFRVSAYTKSVEPMLAESLLAPIRAAFRVLGIDVTAGAMSSDVPKFMLSRMPKGAVSAEL